jgi:hypothetical protein
MKVLWLTVCLRNEDLGANLDPVPSKKSLATSRALYLKQ